MTAKALELKETGENVRYAVEGDELVVRIKLDHRNDTGSPKTIRVASTLGNKPIEGTDVIVGINAYVYRFKK